MFLILTGMVSGIISGLGMGGGTVLIIILTNVLNYEQHIAQASNILFFIPTSLMAIWVHFKQKDIDKSLILKLAIPGAIGGIIGSFIGSKLLAILKGKYLKLIFILFLIYSGIKIVFF